MNMRSANTDTAYQYQLLFVQTKHPPGWQQSIEMWSFNSSNEGLLNRFFRTIFMHFMNAIWKFMILTSAKNENLEKLITNIEYTGRIVLSRELQIAKSTFQTSIDT